MVQNGFFVLLAVLQFGDFVLMFLIPLRLIFRNVQVQLILHVDIAFLVLFIETCLLIGVRYMSDSSAPAGWGKKILVTWCSLVTRHTQ